jgi:hypothetical protein
MSAPSPASVQAALEYDAQRLLGICQDIERETGIKAQVLSPSLADAGGASHRKEGGSRG